MKAIYGFFSALGVIGIFSYIALIVLMLWGWVLNIIALVGMVDGGVTTMFILRVAGVFIAPLGGILGWFA